MTEERIAQARERLAKMRALATNATRGPWVDDWWFGNETHRESYAVRADPSTVARTNRLKQGWADACYIAAVSPDFMLPIVAAAEDTLDKHTEDEIVAGRCDGVDHYHEWPWPCPDLEAILQMWAP